MPELSNRNQHSGFINDIVDPLSEFVILIEPSQIATTVAINKFDLGKAILVLVGLVAPFCYGLEANYIARFTPLNKLATVLPSITFSPF